MLKKKVIQCYLLKYGKEDIIHDHPNKCGDHGNVILQLDREIELNSVNGMVNGNC